MDLYSMMRNIRGKNNEEGLIKAIQNVKKELIGLTEERMCKVYNGYLFNELVKNHIPAKLVNTLDYGYDYEHVFVLVLDNNEGYFLADLTFSQFNIKDEYFNHLIKQYYQKVNNKDIELYLNTIFNQITKQQSIRK